MSSSQSSFVRYDLVIYGASGFTGNYILECFVRSEEYGKLTIAVAGRSESKLRKTLTDIGLLTGKDLSEIPILIADSANGEQLAQMAKRAKVIVNAVGPYQLYGEPVVRAAIENGASHVDVSGEISWMESMQRKYGTLAKQQGVFCISACGWDSIPCDLGVNFLKEKFPGTLSHAEVFAQFNDGPEGSQINTGTYQTILLALQQKGNENLEEIRKEIMPERIGITKWGPPKRFTLWWNDALKCYCLPFIGSDNSVVKRSQYFDAVNNKAFPTAIQTYLCLPNAFYAIGILLWLFVVNILVKFRYTRAILEKYPSICSFGKFSENGPSRKQVEEASFEMWFFGTGWPNGTSMDQAPPTKHMTVRCDGPDAGYRTTAGCALASAITILKERERMPAESGVLSPAAAFKNTDIYGHLSSFGVNFQVINDD